MQEIVFETDRTDTDAISDQLIGLGALSVTVEDAQAESAWETPLFGEPGMASSVQAWPNSRFLVLLDPHTRATEFWADFCSQDSGFHEVPYEIRSLDDRDWVAETQRQFTPFAVGDRLWVGPHWREPPASVARSGIVVRLDPGMAFGTGSHATTQLCLEQLLAFAEVHGPLDRVLDMGCGSGILAIAAAKLGAEKVYAVDIDPIAIATAEENARANAVQITTQSAETPLDQAFDLVIANILCQPLKVLAPMLTRLTRPQGGLLLSGILARQADEILEVYGPIAKHLGMLSVLRERDGWVCIGTPVSH